MYIRRTTVKSRQQGENYHTYRLVESQRVGDKVKQQTLLNLGRHFSVDKEQWPLLTTRIEQLLHAQSELLPLQLPAELEQIAQNLFAKLHQAGYGSQTVSKSIQSVDMTTLEVSRPRTVGIEQIALHALQQLQLTEILQKQGFNRHQLAAAVGTIIGRMAFPCSELATHRWLQNSSALGELIGYDYTDMGHDRLYQISDLLWQHKDAIEQHLWQREQDLFSLQQTITLYDLTNTFFEGAVTEVEKAQRGRSKERRSDCPLITLAIVLDGSGFPRTSRHFAGNASEPGTLRTMLTTLQASADNTIVMDAGIASEANLQWLRDNNYRYIVVSRQRHREFDSNAAVLVNETPSNEVRAQRILDAENNEVQLYCHSQAREQKDRAILDTMAQRLEAALTRLHDGLTKKGCLKKASSIQQRIGRLKQKYAQAAACYDITVTEQEEKVTAIHWQRIEKADSAAANPGVYCLRSNQLEWDESTLWHTYTMLTDLEAVFRSLKSELGMRPVYHQQEKRIDGHLFITLLAYHLVHMLRYQLKSNNIHHSWETLRQLLGNRQRVTVTLQREDKRSLHIRKTTRIEPPHQPILDALGLDYQAHPAQIMLV